MVQAEDIAVCPFTVVVDSNEGHPYAFRGFRTRASDGSLPLVIQTVQRALWSMHKLPIDNRYGHFEVGLADYSIEGLEERVQVERKSLSDLYSTLGQRRGKFEAEIERLNQCEAAFVIIEADWRAVARGIPDSQLNPKSVTATITSWQQRYPNVHWDLMGSRSMAEQKTFWTLERFWLKTQKQ